MSAPGPLDSKVDPEERIAQLRAAIAAQEALRLTLGDAIVDAAVATLREQLAALERERALPTPKRAERKLVTILFADLAGFTTLAEQTDPETARRLMNACFDALKEALDRYGGHIDKYIGDGVMVLFGAPVAYENHAERALRAALELQNALASFNERLIDDPHLAHLPEEFRTPNLHIGVNSGLVIAGGIGAQAHQQYSVVGDAVNVASRLTDLSKAGQILVGEATYELTAPFFEFASLLPVQLKGKREPQPVYELHGLRVQPRQIRGLETLGLRAPLVGRDVEVKHLQEAIARLQAGQGDVISVVGEAGVGKSRLVAELRKQTPAAWYEGRCLSYGQMLSYHPFLALLRNFIGATPEADVPTLNGRLHGFLDDLSATRAADFYPYLADLLGLPLDAPTQERINHLAGESRQWQAFQAFEEVLSQLAQRSPTVIVLEDLHWADPTSLVLLEQLLLLARGRPVLFLLVLRPFSSPLCERLLDRLRAAPDLPYEEVRLAPLSPAHSQELIEYLLIIEALSEPVRDLILSRAEGNPLFLEEILRALISQGVLRRENDHWRVAPGVRVDQIAIPTTLQGVILARLDRLEAETKAVLQMAAVIGRIFWYRVLDYVTSVEQQLESILEQHLTHLEQVELIRQTRRHPDLEYIFKHVLIQEAAYQSLLREQRRLFHWRVAEALETIFAPSLEEHYGRLAHHYEAAGEMGPAIRYLRLAGDRARRAYALAEAEGYYQRALDLLPSTETETHRQLLFDLGLVNLTRGDFATAGEHYAAAFQRQRYPASLQQTLAQRPLRISWPAPPRTLDPGIPVDIDSARVTQQLFAGLVEFDAELNVVPHVAERWEVDPEGRQYRFHLRQDARWSDGTPLTAHDFTYAWRRCLDPTTGSETAKLLYVLRGAAGYHQGHSDDPTTIGARALDDHTLEVELVDPVAYFLPLLTAPAFYPLPRHSWPPARSPQEDPAGLVVNGPFRLVEWQADGKIVLQRNLSYHGITQGNLDRIEINFGLRAPERARLYLADEVDICNLRRTVAPEITERIPKEHWFREPVLSTFFCGLTPTIPPLDDCRVRQALVLAVDRSRLASLVPEEIGFHARGGFVPPGMPGHSPELTTPYAPERARALLREAGYAHGSDVPPLRCARTRFTDPALFDALIAQWEQELGLNIMPEHGSFAQLIDTLHSDPPHLFPMIWVADYPDPHNFLGEGMIQDTTLTNPSYWNLVEEAARTLDVRRRMSIYHELDRRLVVEEAVIIPLAYGRSTFVAQSRVRYLPLLPIAHTLLKDIIIED